MDLFSIICTTCKSRLKVRDPGAVGQILACPKCGGMVMVKPPPAYIDAGDQKSDVPTATEVEGPALRLDQTFDSSAFDAVEELLSDAPPKVQSPAPVKNQAASPPSKPSAALTGPPAPQPSAPKPRFVGGPPPASKSSASTPAKPHATPTGAVPAPAAKAAANGPVPPAVPKSKNPATRDSNALGPAPPAEMNAAKPQLPGPPPSLVSHRKHWLLMAVSVLLGVVLALSAVAAAIHFFREPVAGQAPAAKGAAKSDPSRAVTPNTSPESPPALSSTEPATGATMPDAPQPNAATSVANSSSPLPPATDTGDPLGLARDSPTVEPAAKGSADPLAKFDRIIGESAADPLAKSTERPPETGSATPPADTSPLKPHAPRPPPREVDVAKRLADPLPAIDTPGTPLADFVQLISDLSTIPITLRADALPLVRASAETAVVVHATNTTVGGALQQALAPLGLEFTELDDQLVVRVAEPAVLNTYAYPMKNLAGDRESMAELAELLQAIVEYSSWGDQADQGAISIDPAKGVLAIRQRQAVHSILVFLCEKLRTASGKPHASSRFDPSFFTLDSRAARARARLDTIISLNYIQPTRLVTVLHKLGEMAGLRILIDWHDIATVGWNPSAEASLVANNQPLSAALDSLLGPLDLTWRIIDGQTLQVVTPARLAEQCDLEVYKVDGLMRDDATAEALLRNVRHALGEGVFRDGGGNGEVRYEQESKSLLAWLPQPKQRELEGLLTKWRREGAK